MAKMTVSGFRREAEKLREGRSRGSARYPARLKAFALRYAEAQRAKGRPRAQAAKDLGLCDVTLYGWQKERDAVPGRLAPVTVADAPDPAKSVVATEARPCCGRERVERQGQEEILDLVGAIPGLRVAALPEYFLFCPAGSSEPVAAV